MSIQRYSSDGSVEHTTTAPEFDEAAAAALQEQTEAFAAYAAAQALANATLRFEDAHAAGRASRQFLDLFAGCRGFR